MENTNLANAGVIVRADGGTGLLALDEHKLIERNDEPSKLLLIVDVNDRHHPKFASQLIACACRVNAG